jgi:hypothetical protein
MSATNSSVADVVFERIKYFAPTTMMMAKYEGLGIIAFVSMILFIILQAISFVIHRSVYVTASLLDSIFYLSMFGWLLLILSLVLMPLAYKRIRVDSELARWPVYGTAIMAVIVLLGLVIIAVLYFTMLSPCC